MTTLISTLDKTYIVKVAAVEIAGKLFARASIETATNLVTSVDEEVVSSFADARDAALSAAIEITTRSAKASESKTTPSRKKASSSPHKDEDTTSKESEVPTSEPVMETISAEPESEKGPAPLPAVAAPVEPETSPATEEMPSDEENVSSLEKAEPEKANSNEEAAKDSSAGDCTNACDADSLNEEDSALEAALSQKLTIKEDAKVSSALEKYVGEELRVLHKQKPSMIRLLINRPSLLTSDCLDALKVIAKHAR